MSRVLPPVRLRAGRRGLVLTRVPTNSVPASANIPRTHITHTHTHTRTHTHTYAHAHTHTHMHTHSCPYSLGDIKATFKLGCVRTSSTRIHIYVQVYIRYISQKFHGCLYMYLYIYVCVYVCECVRVWVWVWVYVYDTVCVCLSITQQAGGANHQSQPWSNKHIHTCILFKTVSCTHPWDVSCNAFNPHIMLRARHQT